MRARKYQVICGALISLSHFASATIKAVAIEYGLTLCVEFGMNRAIYRTGATSSPVPCFMFPALLLGALLLGALLIDKDRPLALGLFASIPISAMLMLNFIQSTGGWN